MKTLFKSILVLTCIVAGHFHSYAQQAATTTTKLNMGRWNLTRWRVTYNKTSHPDLPAAIRYVDLGSEYLIADKAGGYRKCLACKSICRDFDDEETNFR